MSSVLEIEKLAKDNETLKKDLSEHKTAGSWAKEGVELARKVTYLDCTLKMANRDIRQLKDIPDAPADYGKKAGATARYCVAKAGPRLADVLREIAGKN